MTFRQIVKEANVDTWERRFNKVPGPPVLNALR